MAGLEEGDNIAGAKGPGFQFYFSLTQLLEQNAPFQGSFMGNRCLVDETMGHIVELEQRMIRNSSFFYGNNYHFNMDF